MKGKRGTKYFFSITISWTEARAIQVRTRSGVANVYPGETQESVYEALMTETCKMFGAPAAAISITNYYLARNEL